MDQIYWCTRNPWLITDNIIKRSGLFEVIYGECNALKMETWMERKARRNLMCPKKNPGKCLLRSIIVVKYSLSYTPSLEIRRQMTSRLKFYISSSNFFSDELCPYIFIGSTHITSQTILYVRISSTSIHKSHCLPFYTSQVKWFNQRRIFAIN